MASASTVDEDAASSASSLRRRSVTFLVFPATRILFCCNFDVGWKKSSSTGIFRPSFYKCVD